MANNKLLNPAKQRTYGLGNGPNKAIRTKKHSQLLQSKIKSDELANQRSHNSQTKITNKSKLQRNHVMVPEEDKIYTSVIQRIIEQQDKLRAQGKMVPRQYQSLQRDQTKINPLPRVHRTIRTRQPTYTIPKEEFLPQQQGLADLQKCILNKRSVETLLNNKLKPGKDLKEDWSSKECPGSDKTKIRMTTSEFGHDSAEKRSLRSEESDEKKEALWKLLNVSKSKSNCKFHQGTGANLHDTQISSHFFFSTCPYLWFVLQHLANDQLVSFHTASTLLVQLDLRGGVIISEKPCSLLHFRICS